MKTPRSLVDTLHQKGYWTIHQFYNYLHDHHRMVAVAYPTLHRYWVDQKLIGRKVGGQIRIPKEEVIRFLKARGEVLVGSSNTGGGRSESSSQPPESKPSEVYEAPHPLPTDDPTDPSDVTSSTIKDDVDDADDEGDEDEAFIIPIQQN